MIQDKILLVGCGNMGTALLKGWVSYGVKKSNICVIEPKGIDLINSINGLENIKIMESLNKLNPSFLPNIIIFAVKPQIARDILPLYSRFIDNNSVFLSIMAGLTVDKIKSFLFRESLVVRAMPNMAASIRSSITVMCSDNNINKSQKLSCQMLMETIGEVEWIDDEDNMDAVTAISGSGPAYIFLFCESLIEAGVESGLTPELSETLAISTLNGACKLLSLKESSPLLLRQSITSPGGTTAAALEVLMSENGMKRIISKAVESARKKSRVISDKGF